MDALTAMVIAQAGQAVVGAGVGAYQLTRANKLRKELDAMGRPEMNALVDSLGEVIKYEESIIEEARQLAREGLPTESKMLAEMGIDRAGANAMRDTSSRRGGLATIGGIAQIETDAMMGLAEKDAMVRMDRQNNVFEQMNRLSATQKMLAEAKGQQEIYNKIMPYEEKRTEMQALLGAGLQNVTGVGQAAAVPLYYGSQDSDKK